jgi:hypothetical protein
MQCYGALLVLNLVLSLLSPPASAHHLRGLAGKITGRIPHASSLLIDFPHLADTAIASDGAAENKAALVSPCAWVDRAQNCSRA